MLLAVGILDGAVDLAVNAHSCEGGKGGLPAWLKVTDCLKQPDHSLLNQVIGISAYEKHGPGFLTHKAFIFLHEIILNNGFSIPQTGDQFFITYIIELSHSSSGFYFILWRTTS